MKTACTLCGKLFKKKIHNQKICGSVKCRKELNDQTQVRKRAKKRKHLKSYSLCNL